MAVVVGVRFKDSGKIYHFDPQEVPLMVGDWAIVDTSRGPELGRIAAAPGDLPPDELVGEVKPVIRRASPHDLASLAHYEQYLDEALAICAEKVKGQNLPMRMVKAEYSFDGSRLTFFFTADKRVDFRLLVRELARIFHTRIELRQIGPRDEAKLLGGIGPCGRALCCSTFLPDYAKVSIKMAKDQDLPLNPVKVSGVCGRLLCCLSYEEEQYLEIKAELPPLGAWVQTPEGPGEVVTVNVVHETVTVQLNVGTTGDFTAAQISSMTEQVAIEARSRNAAGITPASQLQAELAAGLDPDALDVLARLEDTPREVERPHPAPRALRPEATILPTRAPRAPTGGGPVPPRPSTLATSGPERPSSPGQDAVGQRGNLPSATSGAPLRPDDVTPAEGGVSKRVTSAAPGEAHGRPKGGRAQRPREQSRRLGPGAKASTRSSQGDQPTMPAPAQRAGAPIPPERRAMPSTVEPNDQPSDKGEASRRHRKRNRGERPKE
ncbi:MAG: hypothetical protein H0X37_25075 [Herpetosiphonaceae bacterium]|nr:hypothetical protein [Herpetosiphonaceae bacterium]